MEAANLPETGQVVIVRQHRYIVTDVKPNSLEATDPTKRGQTLVSLRSIEDDAANEILQVIWEIESDNRIDETLNQNLELARQLRKEQEAFTVIDIRDVDAKAELAAKSDAVLRKVKEGCDMLVGAQLSDMKKDERDGVLTNLIQEYQAKDTLDSYDAQRLIKTARNVNACLWQFEFPEVFEKGGFDGFVGNLPII